MTTRQTGTKLQAQPGDILVVVRMFDEAQERRSVRLTFPIRRVCRKKPR